jgi:hypothetical protein
MNVHGIYIEQSVGQYHRLVRRDPGSFKVPSPADAVVFSGAAAPDDARKRSAVAGLKDCLNDGNASTPTPCPGRRGPPDDR